MPRDTFERKARTPLPRRLLTLALFAACALAFAAPAASAQSLDGGSPDLVISQVYTRGGEPGATFRNDYVEVFNRGNTSVNIADYTLQVLVNAPPGFPGGLVPINILFVSSSGGVPVLPGEYKLYQFGSSGNNGAALPVTPDASATDFNLPSGAGRVALVKGRANAAFAHVGCAVGVDASLADFVSYGAATCVEGAENLPAPSPTAAAVRNVGGCADTDNNVADFAAAAPNPRATSSPVRPCNMPAPARTVQFEAAGASVNEAAGFAEIFVTRTGDASDFAYFRYATSDDTATERSDYTTTIGSFVFAKGESRTSFRVPVTDDVRPEGGESLTVSLGAHNFPAGTAALGERHIMKLGIVDDDSAIPKPNPVDATDFFVRQHYADFLSRAADAPGLQFWTGEIEGCGANQPCREVRRINVSAAFFLSIEFQDSGYFAYRAYKAAFPDGESRPRGFPLYRELWQGAQAIAGGVIVGEGVWQQRLEANKLSFTGEFVTRPEFRLRYPPSMTPAQFVDAVNENTGAALSASERQREIDDLTSSGNGDGGRGLVFKHILDDEDFKRSEKNRAFVLMEYFGYLRRNPNDPPQPGRNFDGYDFWLAKLEEFQGNFVAAEMVKAFITSDEYRARFGGQ
jgi:hypothetical protein